MITILKDNPISQENLTLLCQAWFGSFVKIVVDVELEILAAGGELHADAEAKLLEQGSLQGNIWGANFYPFKPADKRLEYTALINIRPRDDNPGMEIISPEIRTKVKYLAEHLLLKTDQTLN